MVGTSVSKFVSCLSVMQHAEVLHLEVNRFGKGHKWFSLCSSASLFILSIRIRVIFCAICALSDTQSLLQTKVFICRVIMVEAGCGAQGPRRGRSIPTSPTLHTALPTPRPGEIPDSVTSLTPGHHILTLPLTAG